MSVQDAGEMPIGLCVYDKTLTWWLSALLILSLFYSGCSSVHAPGHLRKWWSW